jgi:hypothetical protein
LVAGGRKENSSSNFLSYDGFEFGTKACFFKIGERASEAKYPTKDSQLNEKPLSVHSVALSVFHFHSLSLFSNANFASLFIRHCIIGTHKSNCRAAIYMTIALRLWRRERTNARARAFSLGVHKYLRRNTNREIDPPSPLCLL